MKELPESIVRWEKRYNIYRTKGGKELDDLTRQNILLSMLPVKIEARMRFHMHPRDRDTVYSTLRHELLDMVINVAGSMPVGMDLDPLDTPSVPTSSQGWYDSLPEELKAMFGHQNMREEDDDEDDDDDSDLEAAALRKGGGKKGDGRKGGQRGAAPPKGRTKGDGRADDRPKCRICRKPGHTPDMCWSNPDSKVYKGPQFREKVMKSLKAVEGEDAQQPGVRLKRLGGLDLGALPVEDSDDEPEACDCGDTECDAEHDEVAPEVEKAEEEQDAKADENESESEESESEESDA